MKSLLIIGTGNFSKIVHEYAQRCPEYGKDWVVKGFLSSEADIPNDKVNPFDNIDNYAPDVNDVFICSYVNGIDRIAAVEKIVKKGGTFINIIHPTANICSTTKIGTGNIIGAFATLSVDTIIGDHNIIQDHCSIGHDSAVGNFSHLYVGSIISGKNQIGNNAAIFTGSIVYPKCKIGDNAIVGAGSVVMRNVKPSTTVLGNPAKIVE